MQVARRARCTPFCLRRLRRSRPLMRRRNEFSTAPAFGAARRVYEVGVWRIMSILCDDISNNAVDWIARRVSFGVRLPCRIPTASGMRFGSLSAGRSGESLCGAAACVVSRVSRRRPREQKTGVVDGQESKCGRCAAGPDRALRVAPTRGRPSHRNVEGGEVARRRVRCVPRSRADDVLPALVHDGRRGDRQLLRDRDAKRRHQAAVRNRNRARRRILPRLRGDLIRGQREASLQYLDPGRSGRKDRRQIPQGARARTSGA